MANLLGDIWPAHEEQPAWDAALAVPGVSLHLYGKSEVKPGRKMGHLTATSGDVDQAVQAVLNSRERISQHLLMDSER